MSIDAAPEGAGLFLCFQSSRGKGRWNATYQGDHGGVTAIRFYHTNSTPSIHEFLQCAIVSPRVFRSTLGVHVRFQYEAAKNRSLHNRVGTYVCIECVDCTLLPESVLGDCRIVENHVSLWHDILALWS